MELAFPADRIVGIVDWGQIWDVTKGPTLATGTIVIPDSSTVDLKVFTATGSTRQGEGWSIHPDHAVSQDDLRFLEDLPAHAVSSLTLGRVDESTFAAVSHLAPGLDHLYLHGNLTDEVLPFVASLSRLTYLQAYGNNFTDAGVQQLVALQQLESLYLEEPSLSIAAFDFVAQLPNLRRLGVMDVPLSTDELKSLKNRLPGVDVG